jgi:hypothetical protein
MEEVDRLERERMRDEILRDLAPLLFENLAAGEWGRVLVHVGRRADGTLRVTDLDVEDVFGDDGAIDAAMAGSARTMLPVLARAVDALTSTFDLDVDALLGGTFVRRDDDGFAFLPGLVRAPSEAFERLREGAMSRAGERLGRLSGGLGGNVRHRFDLDVDLGQIRLFEGDVLRFSGQATLLGSFADVARTWVWAWANPSASQAVQQRAQALCDASPHRSMWELTTPQFASDEATAWALAAIVADADDGAILLRAPRDEGALFVMLRGLVAAEGA